jgi:N-acetyl-anhydromuramyl-L-alanine amidase AmpD
MMRNILIYLLLIFLSSSNGIAADMPAIIKKQMNSGFKKSSNRKIDVIIIHSVYNASGGDIYDIPLIIKQFQHYGVSSHFLIGRDGSVYRLVDEKDIAYHAGKSYLPDGSAGINTRSIGIELVTNLTDSITSAQQTQVISLVKYLKSKYSVKFLLRHSDIAPGRKTDPWNFDWTSFLTLVNE